MSHTVISVENVSKRYRLGLIGGGTLSADLERWWARMRGRPDPLLKIGQEDRSNRQGEYIWALRDVSFQVQQGEVVGIIGRNGAGKSTLLKILSRVTAPTSGQVRVKGRVASLLEVGTGFHPELTGRENIYLNGAILGMKKAEIERKFDEIVAFAEIEKFMDTPVKRYSSGMYVRLAFAVAAHLEPEILLVDEVLAVGDAAFQKRCLGKMEEVAKEGRTVLFVSHQLAMVRTLCEDAILLNEGRIVERGPAGQVVDHYTQMAVGDSNVSAIAQFPKDPTMPAQILGASVVGSDGQSSDRYDVFDQIELRVLYVIREPLEGVAAGLGVERNAERLFVSFDTDNHPQRLDCREPGFYSASVRFPTPLKSGRYTVNLSLCKPNGYGIDDRQNALAFDVEDLSFDTSMRSYGASRPGVMAVHLNWQTHRIDSKDEPVTRSRLMT